MARRRLKIQKLLKVKGIYLFTCHWIDGPDTHVLAQITEYRQETLPTWRKTERNEPREWAYYCQILASDDENSMEDEILPCFVWQLEKKEVTAKRVWRPNLPLYVGLKYVLEPFIKLLQEVSNN
jgi:hypothetical protein